MHAPTDQGSRIGTRWRAQFSFPLATASGGNRRELFPGERAARVTKERSAMLGAWSAAGRPRPPSFPALVLFERRSGGKLDSDSLPTAFKALRDELAELWGLRSDAAKHPILWRYTQVRAPGAGLVMVKLAGPINVRVCGHCGDRLVAGVETCPSELYWL